MNKIINRFLDYQIKSGCLKESEKDIYIYAYTILIEECINVFVAFMIGLFMGRTKLILFFLCAYIPLRRFAGGYHAERSLSCGIVSTLIIVLLCLFENFDVFALIPNRYLFLSGVQFFVLIVAPIDSKNKKLSSDEKRDYRKKTRVILLLQVLMILVAILLKKRNLALGFIFSHIVLSGMLLLGICKNYLSNMMTKSDIV